MKNSEKTELNILIFVCNIFIEILIKICEFSVIFFFILKPNPDVSFLVNYFVYFFFFEKHAKCVLSAITETILVSFLSIAAIFDSIAQKWTLKMVS